MDQFDGQRPDLQTAPSASTSTTSTSSDHQPLSRSLHESVNSSTPADSPELIPLQQRRLAGKRKTSDTPSVKQLVDRFKGLIAVAKQLKAEGVAQVDSGQVSQALRLFAAAIVKLEQVDPHLLDRNKHKHGTNNKTTKEPSQLPPPLFHVGMLRGSIHDMRAQLLMGAKQDFRAVQEAELAVGCAPSEWTFHQTLARAQLNLGEVA